MIKGTPLKFLVVVCFLGTATMAGADSGYVVERRGAIADHLYYQIGGGSVIIPILTRRSASPMEVGLSWSNDLICSNFDLRTTVKNQLSGATEGFKDLMGDVIHSATGAVASLPAMIIQRANPQLYDLLTNGVLQGRLDFDKARLNCLKMTEKMTDFAYGPAWTQGAKAENYQTIASSEKDAVRADRRADREAAEKGKRWVGGEKRGGRGQPPIRVVKDTTIAGYNILNARKATDQSSISSVECKGELCKTWQKPEDAAQWVVRTVGDQAINVSSANDQSGHQQNKTSTQAGRGLTPLILEEQEKIIHVISDLVNNKLKPTPENLAKASSGNLYVTRGVIEALKDEPDAAVLIQRLSGEMALGRVMEQALMARRTLLAGMREPHIANEKEAQDSLGKTVSQLDQELTQLKLELDLRKTLSDNAATVILERKAQRERIRGQAVEIHDDIDNRVYDLNHTSREG